MTAPTSAAFLDADSFGRYDETVRAVHAELNLDTALRRIVELARELVGARYAALGIVGADGYLSDFITAGISAAEREAIGPLPRGHGILGVLIGDQRPLRLRDLHDHPRSSGFPPHHPPMTSFLGVPIRLGEEAIGNFYLTDKIGAAEFSAEDQRLVERLAQHAGVAVLNARRYTETEIQRGLLRAMVEHMPDAVTIRAAPGGELLAANDRARDLLGIVTLPAGGIADDGRAFAATRPSGQPYMLAETPTMRALTAGDITIEKELVIRDAAGRPVHYAVSAIPVGDAVGKVTAVVSLFRDVTEAREVEARHPSHATHVVAERGLPPAEGDEELLTQVVRNLAENAAKYPPDGGTITLAVAAYGPEIVVAISDEGPGIPPEQQQRIFQRFHRASTGTQGMGLGLYLCQRLVEAHGGRIWVESTPGSGATFRFTIPVAQGDE